MSKKLVKKYSEWSYRNKFNAFNTMKVLKHLNYWEGIKNALEQRGFDFPPPVAVTVDLSLACNLQCSFCNAKNVMDNSFMSPEWCISLPKFLKEWGVKAVTIAGGGEPLLNKHASMFMYACKEVDMPLGLITNGTMIGKHKEAIMDCCSWVGVSIDAGNSKTYERIKGIDFFNSVIQQTKSIADYNIEVTYKYLVCPENIQDIKIACQIAKDIGCNQIHIRPMGKAWFEDRDSVFTEEEVNVALENVTKAREEYEDERFKVFGITHKFGTDFKIENDFSKCWSAFMYLLVQPNGVISTCCDRRGDDKVVLAKGLKRPRDIAVKWGAPNHRQMFENIDVKKCCRCTFSLHNQVYENMILEDRTFSDFI